MGIRCFHTGARARRASTPSIAYVRTILERDAQLDGIATPGSVRISAHDVGSRVVIRYRLAPDQHGSHGESLTDVLGELVSYDDVSVVVRRKDGEPVEVATHLVVAAKVVPATVARRRPAGADEPADPPPAAG